MANPEHLKILKQGVEVWNQWRAENPDVDPDLAGANLKDADLSCADLSDTNLSGVNLKRAALRAAVLSAKTTGAAFVGADLEGAHIGRIKDALRLDAPKTTWTFVHVGEQSDFEPHHDSDDGSYWLIREGEETLQEALLRRIVRQSSGDGETGEYHSCFISYSHADKKFARRLHDKLQARGICSWLDEYDLKPGHRILDAVGDAIRLHDKVLLCCSEASLNSWWVKDEIRKAMERERRDGRDIIIPLMVDRYLLDGWQNGLAADLRSRLAADFTGWKKDDEKFKERFERVIGALERENPDSISRTVHLNLGKPRWAVVLSSALTCLVVLTTIFYIWLGYESRTPRETEKPILNRPGVLWRNPLGIRFRYIPSNTFMMGSPQEELGRREDELQPREVAITRPFWIGQTPVTQAQWKAVMGTTPFFFASCGDSCPAEKVNWFEAALYANRLSQEEKLQMCYIMEGCENGQEPDEGLFCSKVEFAGLHCLGYRLPTEAEWELAARAGTRGAVYEGVYNIRGEYDAPVLEAIAWYGGNSTVTYPGGARCSDRLRIKMPASFCGTHPVGKKAPNPWGLQDVLGNIWEWTNDYYESDLYAVSEQATLYNPTGPAFSGYRAVRGGGSWSSVARRCRISARASSPPSSRTNYIGFRLAKTAGVTN